MWELVSDEFSDVFHTACLAILATVIGLFGIATNIVNIVIFLKQGFTDNVNISLFGLAVSDLCALITLEWFNLLRNPLFTNHVPFLPVEVQHLSAAWPHCFFVRVTSWITAYITFERCLCVLVPLKVKRIVTPTFTVSAIATIIIVMFLTLIPDYATCYLGWKFDKDHNMSMVGLIFLEGRDEIAMLSFNLASFTQIASIGAVIIFTIILVFKMKQQSKWRSSTAQFSTTASSGQQNRDSKMVKMVVSIAVIYCICFLPMLVNYILTCVEPEFIGVGLYQNSFWVAWSMAFLVDSVNSSVNIFVYYRMSTKYRTTFRQIILRKK